MCRETFPRVFACLVALSLSWSLPALEPVGQGSAGVDLDLLQGGEKVRALIDQVVARQRSVESLQADFLQIKHSDLLLEPMESHGRFAYLAPSWVRWDYQQPEGMVVAFADDVVITYYPEHQRAESVKISRRNRKFVRVLAGTQPLDDLAANFSISLSDPGAPAHYRLTLEPVHQVLRRRLQLVVLEVDRQLLLPVCVEYLSADGDSTRYELSNMVLNPGFEPEYFDLQLGEDVQVREIDMSSGAG